MINYARIAALAGVFLPGALPPDTSKPVRRRKTGGPRPVDSYRGFRRNVFFGRKPTGNTKPQDRDLFRART